MVTSFILTKSGLKTKTVSPHTKAQNLIAKKLHKYKHLKFRKLIGRRKGKKNDRRVTFILQIELVLMLLENYYIINGVQILELL